MQSIVREPIDVAALVNAARHDEFGAVVTFAGQVRDSAEDGRRVTGLCYEAHEALAEAEFASIADEAQERFGRCEIAIRHRVGNLRVGEVSVVVVVAAPHRGDAFAACSYTIEELKRRAAIWKKELYADGSGEWKPNSPDAPR